MLSKRQRTLVERLITLGDWASNRGLPLDVFEIRGFGSFFRGKPNAKDVDLFMRCQRHPHRDDFTRFLEAVDSIQDDHAVERTFTRPSDGLRAFFESPNKNNALASVNDTERQSFLRWLEPFSWNMLRPQTMVGQIGIKNPDVFAQQAIRYHLPNLNVVEIINPEYAGARPLGLRCGFTVAVWSPERQDVRINLDQLLSEESIRKNLLSELGYFRVQVAVMIAMYQYAQAAFCLSLQEPAVVADAEQAAENVDRSVRPELAAPLSEVTTTSQPRNHESDPGSGPPIRSPPPPPLCAGGCANP